VGQKKLVDLNIVMKEQILMLDALVVTAQKRSEHSVNIPIALSVLDNAFIQRNSQVNLDVLSTYIPGFDVFSNSDNRPNYVIRGLTSDAFLASAQPRVSVFFNNIPISRNTGSVVDLYDLERIEVLNGPQGTLFGRGAQIGAIHIISKKPINVLQGNLAVATGNQGQRSFTAMINVPLTENFYARIAGSFRQRDGFVNNTFGGRLNAQKSAAARSSFRLIPGKNTIMDLIFNYQEDRPGGTAFMSRMYPNQLGRIDVFGKDASLERGNDLGLYRRIMDYTLNMKHYFNPDLDLTTLISYRQHRADEIWDGDGSAAPALDFEENVKVEQITAETRLNFNLLKNVSGFAGISYWREKARQSVRFSPNEQSLFYLFIDPGNLVDDRGNPNLIPAIPALPEFGDLGGLPLPVDHVEESSQKATNQSLESFVDMTYKLNSRMQFTVGLRYIVDRLSFEALNQHIDGQPSALGFLTGNYPNVLFARGEVPEMQESFGALVGRIIARYAFNDFSGAYFGFARGRRPNVIQIRADAQTEILDSEKVSSYELGYKGAMGEHFFMTVAAYLYDYYDFQTRAWVSDQESGEFQLIVKDGGRAHTYGFEADLRYAFNQNFILNANYTYIHARFNETDSKGNEQEYAGNKFRLTPDHTWSAQINLTNDLMDVFDLFIIPGFIYKSHHYFEDDNTSGLEQEGYGLFNLQTGIYYDPWGWELSLFAYNILDKKYLVSAGNTGNLFGIPTFVPGSRFTYGLKLKWDF
jgi:outer membrane receptor protein involved in Fe transport